MMQILLVLNAKDQTKIIHLDLELTIIYIYAVFVINLMVYHKQIE